MANVYALSTEGIHNAEIALERSARRIASGRDSDPSTAFQQDTVDISSAGRSKAVPLDYASEIVAMKEAETALKANLRAFAAQRDMEREAINLYA